MDGPVVLDLQVVDGLLLARSVVLELDGLNLLSDMIQRALQAHILEGCTRTALGPWTEFTHKGSLSHMQFDGTLVPSNCM